MCVSECFNWGFNLIPVIIFYFGCDVTLVSIMHQHFFFILRYGLIAGLIAGMIVTMRFIDYSLMQFLCCRIWATVKNKILLAQNQQHFLPVSPSTERTMMQRARTFWRNNCAPANNIAYRRWRNEPWEIRMNRLDMNNSRIKKEDNIKRAERLWRIISTKSQNRPAPHYSPWRPCYSALSLNEQLPGQFCHI